MNATPDADRLTLRSGALRCEIAPALGGCITGLWLGEVPVLRTTTAPLKSARESASYPLVPFSNRIGNARLSWAGTSHPLIRNFGAEPHAIHGVGWQRAWSVLEQEPTFALLSYEHKPDGAWPFAFDTSQAFRLTADTLELTLSITNQSRSETPVGLGWHPWFAKRPQSRVQFKAQGRWEMDDTKLPTRRRPSAGMDIEAALLDVDHCFDGWGGVLDLQDELLHVRVQSALSRLVVCTRSNLDCIAIEPVTHINNALALLDRRAASAQELGVQVLQPGESLSAEMSIQVRPNPAGPAALRQA
jgi:aldose 1-epimerase